MYGRRRNKRGNASSLYQEAVFLLKQYFLQFNQICLDTLKVCRIPNPTYKSENIRTGNISLSHSQCTQHFFHNPPVKCLQKSTGGKTYDMKNDNLK